MVVGGRKTIRRRENSRNNDNRQSELTIVSRFDLTRGPDNFGDDVDDNWDDNLDDSFELDDN